MLETILAVIQGLPLVVTREHKVPYIKALESADRGDLQSLIELFTSIQSRTLTEALATLPSLSPWDLEAELRTFLAVRSDSFYTANEVNDVRKDLLEFVSAAVSDARTTFLALLQQMPPERRDKLSVTATKESLTLEHPGHGRAQIVVRESPKEGPYRLVFELVLSGTPFEAQVILGEPFVINSPDEAFTKKDSFKGYLDSGLQRGIGLWLTLSPR